MCYSNKLTRHSKTKMPNQSSTKQKVPWPTRIHTHECTSHPPTHTKQKSLLVLCIGNYSKTSGLTCSVVDTAIDTLLEKIDPFPLSQQVGINRQITFLVRVSLFFFFRERG